MKLPSISPAKSPVFYGYVIVIVGTLGVWASLPGQTAGVSTFTDPVKDTLGLSRNQISIAYMIGTFVSSLFLGYAGKWYDKFGARWVALLAAIGLSVTLTLCSQAGFFNNNLKALFNSERTAIPFVLMVVLFFMLRFSGQGVLTLASRNMIMKWFDKLRGRINAFSSTVATLGFSMSPWWINKLIKAHGWQNAWWYMALGLLFFVAIIYLFFRDNPEEFGLIPDGKKLDNKKKEEIPSLSRKQFTHKEALSTRAFWMYSLTLAFYGFFFTGLTFHVISIFTTVGYTEEQAVAIFIPISVVSVAISITGNSISDWIHLKVLLYICLAGGIMAALGLILLSSTIGIILIIAGCGIMGGLYTVLIAIVWPRFYGRGHLGAISGKSMSMVVMASAIGPALFSLSKFFFTSYAVAGILSIVFLTVIALASRKANNPQ